MSLIFKKLNLKNENKIVVLNSQDSFEPQLSRLSNVTIIRDLENVAEISFFLVFVTKQNELNSLAKRITTNVKGDVTLWFAYPKQSSKKYKCDFNRDSGWTVLGEAGYEGVRQVAIDEDWSALRFRKAENITSMRRDPQRAMSAEGKRRTSGK